MILSGLALYKRKWLSKLLKGNADINLHKMVRNLLVIVHFLFSIYVI